MWRLIATALWLVGVAAVISSLTDMSQIVKSGGLTPANAAQFYYDGFVAVSAGIGMLLIAALDINRSLDETKQAIKANRVAQENADQTKEEVIGL